jgi:hypothetical protein
VTSRTSWLPADLVLLDDRCPLPLDRPFTRAQAAALGVPRSVLDTLTRRALVRQVVHGVYVAVQVVDSIELRADALALVVPETAVITDRTAAWLHGVDALPRSAVHEMPPIQIFGRTGSRLRRPGVASGIRELLDSDITVVNGLLVTTPLRTALDLGRNLRRFDALAALDGLLRAGVDRDELLANVERFKGDRGVVQLRWLAPLADARAESGAESVLRLHWLDAGLPPPDLQIWVTDELGRPTYRVDLGLEELRYGVEYDGRAFHGPEREAYDGGRRDWLADRRWLIEVFGQPDVFAPGADPSIRLQRGFEDARRRVGAWVPQGKFLH